MKEITVCKNKNDKSEPIEKYCWIKANLTFNGLKQIVYEPDRIYIGKELTSSAKKTFPP